tara:strand:- start:16 stop:576 length:561 start_codon:yes stop_codon:yes gene_type:complete
MKKLMTEWRRFLTEEQDPLAPLATESNPKFVEVFAGIVASYLAPVLGDFIKQEFTEIVSEYSLDKGKKYLAKKIFQHLLENPESRLSKYETVQGLIADPTQIKDKDKFIESVNYEIETSENPFSINVSDILLGDELYRLRNSLPEYGTWDVGQFLWQVKRELNLKQDETELYNLYMQAVNRRNRPK